MPITPDHWGGPKWLGIHVSCHYIDAVFYADLEKQAQLHLWLKSSAEVLPCGMCEGHFKEFQATDPIPGVKVYGKNEAPYLRWSVRAHNSVRLRQNKPLAVEDDVVAAYQSGVMYGLDAYLAAAPRDRVNLAGADESVGMISMEEYNAYRTTTYVLAVLCGLFLVGGLVTWAVLYLRGKRSRAYVPHEMSV